MIQIFVGKCRNILYLYYHTQMFLPCTCKMSVVLEFLKYSLSAEFAIWHSIYVGQQNTDSKQNHKSSFISMVILTYLHHIAQIKLKAVILIYHGIPVPSTFVHIAANRFILCSSNQKTNHGHIDGRNDR